MEAVIRGSNTRKRSGQVERDVQKKSEITSEIKKVIVAKIR